MVPQAKDTDTRERILAAGAQIVGDKSFNGAGLSEILALAEVPKGSFYHYFPSKEDFGVALIERARDEHLARLMPIVEHPGRSPMERLVSLYEDGRQYCLQHGASRECLIAKMALEHAQLSPKVRDAVRGAYDQWRRILAALLREGQVVGQVTRDQDAERLASMLVMLWEGATLQMQINASIAPVEDMISFLFWPRFLFAASNGKG
ncbi:MAG TPA: TetR family transcriptional regulator C-terminal domain-containing protein [Planctomycetota bacterium]|nr:TetR family transcriptional regulator C-terminal domain-containing protein [Planctomycetota bacterium]